MRSGAGGRKAAGGRRARLALLGAVGALVVAAVAVAGPASAAGSGSTAPVVWSPLHEPGVGGRVTAVSVSPWSAASEVVTGDMLGVAVTADGGASWSGATGLPSYEMASISWDLARPGVVWAGSMSGPVQSLDGGNTWASRRVGMPAASAYSYTAAVEKVLIDPRDDQHLLAVGGSRRGWSSPSNPEFGVVWESLDGGARWSAVATLPDSPNVLDAAWTGVPGQLVIVTAGHGLFESDSFGHAWRPVGGAAVNALDPRSVAVDTTNPQRWWVGTGHGTGGASSAGMILRSEDGGSTWVDSSAGLMAHDDPSDDYRTEYTQVVVAPSDPSVLYAAQHGFWGGNVYGSTDGGRSWTGLITPSNRGTEPYGSAPAASAVAVDPHDARHVLFGGWESLLESHNGGGSWHDISSTVTGSGFTGRGFSGIVAQGVVFGPGGSHGLAVAGMDGANPFVSHDDGATWAAPVHQAYDCYDGSYGVVWTPQHTLYALLGQGGAFNGIARSADDGRTVAVAVGAAAGLPAQYSWSADSPQGIVAITTGPSTGAVLATIGGSLYRSVDSGAHWAPVATGRSYGALALSADGRTVWVSSASGVYVSTDAGSTLTALGGPRFTPENGTLTADPTAAGVVYADGWRTAGGGLWRLAKGAWTRLSADTNLAAVAVDPSDGARLVAVVGDHPYHDVSAGGVLLSTDGGTSWREITGALPVRRASAVAFDPARSGHVVVGTYGGGYWQTYLAAATAANVALSDPPSSTGPVVVAPTAAGTSAVPGPHRPGRLASWWRRVIDLERMHVLWR